MPLVEGRFARHGGVHGNLDELGELLQFRGCSGGQDAHPRPDHRLMGVQQKPDGILNVLGGGRLAIPLGGRIVQRLFRDLLLADVGGDLDENRASASVAQVMEGPAHGTGDLRRMGDDLDGFAHGLVGARR